MPSKDAVLMRLVISMLRCLVNWCLVANRAEQLLVFLNLLHMRKSNSHLFFLFTHSTRKIDACPLGLSGPEGREKDENRIVS